MTLAGDGEVLGASAGEIAVHRTSTEVRIRLAPGALRGLADWLPPAGERERAERVYLGLEHVRGTHDASVLDVYLGRPGAAAAEPGHEHHAGTLALHGLRRASAPAPGSGGGLDFLLDVTPFFQALRPLGDAAGDELVVSLRQRQELPRAAATVIGRMVLFRR